ncbi:Zinc knuckle CX2CX4HX4C [Sesbania bispinosa]|nr:Zinc knuckle CX2CX4HX4C [Sesbania bispinosa]
MSEGNDRVPFIIYDEEDVADGVESCSRSLIGRIITQKPIHVNSLQNALMGIWCNPKGTKKIGIKVGACLGKVMDSEIYENRERGTYIRLLVEINNQKPLLTGIPVGSQKDGVTWVDFRYEKVPKFCYQCGCIGHNEDICKNPPSGSSGEQAEEKTFGPWLRAAHIGWKVIHDQKQRRCLKWFPIRVLE